MDTPICTLSGVIDRIMSQLYAAAKVSKDTVRALPADTKRYLITKPMYLSYHPASVPSDVPRLMWRPRPRNGQINFCAQPLLSACIVGAAMARPQEENVPAVFISGDGIPGVKAL